MATKSLSAHKQTKTAMFENRPIMHRKLSIEQTYIIYANGMVSLLIPY